MHIGSIALPAFTGIGRDVSSKPRNRLAAMPYPLMESACAASPAPAVTETRSDHALMLATRDGELDALGELFERHHQRLFGFLVKVTGDRPAAEDIVQIVFQRMLKYRHTYRDEGSFTTWMYHLARRCVADHFRRASTAARPVDPDTMNLQADDRPHAAQNAVRSDDHALLRTALRMLDDDDRQLLVLARFKELSFAEIAAILDCSVGAAKVRAHRAMRQLRDIYLELQKQPLGNPPAAR